MTSGQKDDQEEDPLEQLYLDKEEVNRERLSEVLQGKIGIDRETGEPYFLGGFGELNGKQKIVSYLLYRKAAVALSKLSDNEEGVESKRIADETGVNYKT
ncbi:MAG: hypothetical protein ACOCT0_02100, partial [Halobacteriota archaeon]